MRHGLLPLMLHLKQGFDDVFFAHSLTRVVTTTAHEAGDEGAVWVKFGHNPTYTAEPLRFYDEGHKNPFFLAEKGHKWL